MKNGNIIILGLGIAGFLLFNSFKSKEVKPVENLPEDTDQNSTTPQENANPFTPAPGGEIVRPPIVDNSTSFVTKSPYVDRYGRPDGSSKQGLVPIFIKRFDQKVARPEFSTQDPSTFAPFAFLYAYFVEKVPVTVYEEADYYHGGFGNVKICRITDKVEPEIDMETATEWLQDVEGYFKKWAASNPKSNELPYKQVPYQTMLNRNLWVLKANLVKASSLSGIRRSI